MPKLRIQWIRKETQEILEPEEVGKVTERRVPQAREGC